MPRPPIIRRISALVVSLALLTASWASAEPRRTEPAPPSFQVQFLDQFAGLWGEIGCIMDPNGLCNTVLDVGCGADPNGRCKGEDFSTVDAGCIMDPYGRCGGESMARDSGCIMDPNGGGCSH